MRAFLFTTLFLLSPLVNAAPTNTTPFLAPDKEPTAVLVFRTSNRGETVSATKIPQKQLTAPSWLLPPNDNQVSYQTQLEVWTPQTVPEDASGGLRSLGGALPQEWALQMTPAPAWPDLPAEPQDITPKELTPLEIANAAEEIKANDPPADNSQTAEITVPETLRAHIYVGCGETAPQEQLQEQPDDQQGEQPQEQPQIARIATAVLERWRNFGRLPHDWGGAGTLGVAQNTLSAAQLKETKTVPRAAGAYRLITSFVPDLNFTIGTEQQFLPPLRLSVGLLPLDWSKPLQINWQPVEGARGYRVRAIGRRFKSTDPNAVIVLWSATPLARLQSEAPVIDMESALKKGEILPPDTLTCAIPAGIFKDVGEITFFLEAIGQTRTFTAPKTLKNAPPGTFGGTTLRVATVSEAFITLDTGQAAD